MRARPPRASSEGFTPEIVVVGLGPAADGLPTHVATGAANGGEYRKSFHGLPPGYAFALASPSAVPFSSPISPAAPLALSVTVVIVIVVVVIVVTSSSSSSSSFSS